jgi:peptidylprolyl isomerase
LFGSVVEGMDVVDKIVQGDTIKSVSIVRIGDAAKQFVVTDDSFRKMVDEAKLKVIAAEEKRLKDEAEAIRKNWPDAQTTKSGLKYIITKEGTGNKPAVGTTIKVRYNGKLLLSEKQFRSTSVAGKPNAIDSSEVFEYTIGITKINPGIDETISDMKLGETRTVIIPSSAAYGTDGFYGKSIPGKKRFIISPNTSLVYEIEIMK